MPLVSILMPVHDRERLVPHAIRSIQNQTFQDWELIIIDDASTDGTLEICRTFEAQDKRIRVYRNERNLGVGRSRNRLLSFANGKYIAVQDSDDVSVPDRLQCEIEVLESQPDIGIVSGITDWVDVKDGRVLWQYPILLHQGGQYPQERMEMVKYLYMGCEVANAACMFRRSLIDHFPEPYGEYRTSEDWYFFVHMAHRTLFWGIPRTLVKMNRGKNHIHLSSAPSKENRLVSQDLYRCFKNDPDSPINFRLYRKSVANLLIAYAIYLGGWRGTIILLRAIAWYPSNGRARRLLRDIPLSSNNAEFNTKWLHA